MTPLGSERVAKTSPDPWLPPGQSTDVAPQMPCPPPLKKRQRHFQKVRTRPKQARCDCERLARRLKRARPRSRQDRGLALCCLGAGQIFETFAACSPFGPCVISNSTRCPSSSERKP